MGGADKQALEPKRRGIPRLCRIARTGCLQKNNINERFVAESTKAYLPYTDMSDVKKICVRY
ncbi:MAG: hypothetical protein L6V93_20610 [Clostridiales bacterium]|nr:MAG: hypothetical protein L6V93_20610 [Clostridiales bacterium]